MTAETEPRAIIAHAELYPSVECPGTIREAGRTPTIVEGECDACGFLTSYRPEVVDRDVRCARILERAFLPARFLDTPLPAHDGTRDARRHIKALIDDWDTPDRPRPPFLVGPYGRGKTHLLTRTARQLIERHEVRTRYLTLADLLDEAKAAFDSKDTSPQQVMDRAASVELLILDDLKELRSGWQTDVVEQLVDRRYRGGLLPVMGATNVPLDRWDDAFGPRVASRLHELTHPVEVGGPDHRRAAA